jgi:hypothetical protein
VSYAEIAGLDVALDMAAFNKCASGGLMPHVWHGGSAVCSLAVVTSKPAGTVFEKEQIGQTHVTLESLGVGVAGE